MLEVAAKDQRISLGDAILIEDVAERSLRGAAERRHFLDFNQVIPPCLVVIATSSPRLQQHLSFSLLPHLFCGSFIPHASLLIQSEDTSLALASHPMAGWADAIINKDTNDDLLLKRPQQEDDRSIASGELVEGMKGVAMKVSGKGESEVVNGMKRRDREGGEEEGQGVGGEVARGVEKRVEEAKGGRQRVCQD